MNVSRLGGVLHEYTLRRLSVGTTFIEYKVPVLP